MTSKQIQKIGQLDFPKRQTRSYFSKDKELAPMDFDDIITYNLKNYAKNPIREYVQEKISKIGTKTNEKCTVILFYAPWCKFCKETKKIWKELQQYVPKKINLKAFNCEKYKDHLMKMKIDFEYRNGQPFFSTYPTIILYKRGQPHTKFNGERNIFNLVEFCKNN